VASKKTLTAAVLLGGALAAPPGFGQASPPMSDAQRIVQHRPPEGRPVPMVLDTDTYNEIDDQFALVYALLT